MNLKQHVNDKNKYISQQISQYTTTMGGFSTKPISPTEPQLKKFIVQDLFNAANVEGGPVYVLYGDNVIDITDFINIHPGGAEVLKNDDCLFDITQSVANHSPEAKIEIMNKTCGTFVGW